MTEIGMILGVDADTNKAEQKFQHLNQTIQNATSLVADSSNPNLTYRTSESGIITDSHAVNPQVAQQLERQKNTNNLLNESFKKITEISSILVESLREMNGAVIQSARGLKNNPNEPLRDNLTDNAQNEKSKNEDDKKPSQDWRQAESVTNLVEKVLGVVSGVSKGHLAYTQQAITGDVAGANLSWNDTMAGTAKSAGGLLAGVGTMTGMLPLTVLGGLLGIGGAVADIWNDRKKEDHAYALQYKAALPQLTSVGAAFGGEGIRNLSSAENSRNDLNQWSTLNRLYNRDTGMDNAAFTQLATNFAQHGITSLDSAGHMAQSAAKWARFTGGDASQFADFMGKMTRFGSMNAENDVGYAYSAAKNSGLSKNQMPEFLRGLQQVIEDGISKGYVKSTKDVSDTLSMFGKMSGGHIAWTGQQGANKLMQMNAGLAAATSLSDPAQIIAYQAFSGKDTSGKDWHMKGAGAYNTFALMEEGVNSGNIKDVVSGIKSTYGGDVQQQIEAVKKIYGLNNIGAMQFLKFSESGDFTAAKNVTEKANYLNNETKMYNVLSKINDAVVNLGKNKFEVEIKDSEVYAKKIYELLSNKDKEEEKTLVEKEAKNVESTYKKLESNLIKGNAMDDGIRAEVGAYYSAKNAEYFLNYDENVLKKFISDDDFKTIKNYAKKDVNFSRSLGEYDVFQKLSSQNIVKNNLNDNEILNALNKIADFLEVKGVTDERIEVRMASR